MHIKQLTLDQFKGRGTIVRRLAPRLLLVGPRGSGKTTLMNALQFAFEGQVPQGGTLDHVAMLAGPRGLGVTVEMDDGFAWTRLLTHDQRTHKLSMELLLDGRPAPLKEGEQMVAQRVGRFAPMFDLRRCFLGLSAEKRRGLVLQLCDRAQGAIDADSPLLAQVVFAAMAAMVGEGAAGQALANAGVSDQAQATGAELNMAITSLRGQLAASQRDALGYDPDGLVRGGGIARAVEHCLVGPPAQALASALEAVNQLANESNGASSRARQAARELSAQRAGLAAPTTGVDDLRTQRGTLAAERDDIIAQLANQAGRATARQHLQQRMARVTEELGAADKRAVAEKALEQATELLAQQTKTLDAAQAKLPAADVGECDPVTALAEAQQQRRLADQAWSDAGAAHRRAGQSVDNLTINRRGLELDLTKYAADPWQQVQGIYEKLRISLDSSLVACDRVEGDRPRFHAAIEEMHQGIKGLGELVAQHLNPDLLKDAEGQLEVVKAKLVTATQVGKEAGEALAARRKELDDLTAKCETLQIEAGLAAELNAAVQAAHVALSEAKMAHARRQDELTALEQRQAALQEELIAAQRELQELDTAGGHVALDDLTNQRDNLTTRIAELEALEGTAQKLDQLNQAYTDTIAQAESRMVFHETAKVVAAAIKQLRDEHMAQYLTPLFGRLDTFIQAATGCKLYYHLTNPRGKAVFELGWIKEGQTIALEAMSGGEQAIFNAGLAYALTAAANPPLKLLLLEAGELDMPSLFALLAAISEHCPEIGHAIVATHLPVEACSGWTVAKLGQDD